MIVIGSIASALGINPLDALSGAVQQAGARANPSAAAAAHSAEQTAAAAKGTPHHAHHDHPGVGGASPVGTFVGTLERALATLKPNERSPSAANPTVTTIT